jgi:hypothetical protein
VYGYTRPEAEGSAPRGASRDRTVTLSDPLRDITEAAPDPPDPRRRHRSRSPSRRLHPRRCRPTRHHRRRPARLRRRPRSSPRRQPRRSPIPHRRPRSILRRHPLSIHR